MLYKTFDYRKLFSKRIKKERKSKENRKNRTAKRSCKWNQNLEKYSQVFINTSVQCFDLIKNKVKLFDLKVYCN
jgi:hypothetical protein